MANTGTQCFFGVSDIATANLVSEMAGTTTVVNRSYGSNIGYTYGESEQQSHATGSSSQSGHGPGGETSSSGSMSKRYLWDWAELEREYRQVGTDRLCRAAADYPGRSHAHA